MSIEQSFERMAVALEKLAGMTKVEIVQPVNTGAKAYADKVVAVVDKVVEKALIEPTEEEIRTSIRGYMNTNGKEKAIELLITYGANKEKPMIKDVKDKTGLMREIM